MTGYPVLCYRCGHAATHKIAATWSDGLTSELKTYSLCCEACLPESFDDAKRRHAACPRTMDETLDVPKIFAWVRDAAGTRLTELANGPPVSTARD